MEYGIEDDIFRYGDKVKMNFCSTVFSGVDHSGLKAHLTEHLDVIAHYPESNAHTLETMLAERLEIPEDTVMVTNGANEAVYLIAQLYKGWASVIPQPTYIDYDEACRMFDHVISYNTADELELLPEDRIYWLCNPNNPTGNVLLKKLIYHIVRTHPRYLYVVDQSYADYTLSPMLQPKEMKDVYNAMLIHSFSKKYCIPGLRLGYVTASPIIIDRLKQIRRPYAVNAMAIEAGKYLLQNDPPVISDLEKRLEEAQRLFDKLSAVEGLIVMNTSTNYMLVNIDVGEVLELKNWLIKNYGILICDVSAFRGLDNHCFRVTSQTPEENDALVEALTEYCQWKRESELPSSEE